jgi:hypothetical protein
MPYNDYMNEDTNLWEYRVLSDVDNCIYGIHTVYITDQGIPVSYDKQPIAVSSDSVENLSYLMIHAMSAFTKPVLEYSYFNPTSESINTAMGILNNEL